MGGKMKKFSALVMVFMLLSCNVLLAEGAADSRTVNRFSDSVYEATATSNSGWTIRRQNNWVDKSGTVDRTVYKSGTTSVKLPMEGAAGHATLLTMRTTNKKLSDVLEIGKTYNFSFWMKKDTYDLSSSYLHIYFKANGTNYEVHYNGGTSANSAAAATCAIANTTDWQFMSYTFTVDHNNFNNAGDNTLPELWIQTKMSGVSTGQGYVWVDCIRLVEVPAENELVTAKTSTVPADNAANVPVDTAVTFKFSGIVDATRLSDSNVYINGVNNNGTKISGSIDYENSISSITVKPGTPLNADTQYTFSLSGIKDIWDRAYTGEAPAVSFKTLADISTQYDFFLKEGDTYSPITSLQEGTVKAQVTVTSNTGKVTSAVMVMALCKGQTIRNFALAPISGLQTGTPQSFSAELSAAPGAGESLSDYSIRCFMIDAVGTFRPVDSVKDFK